MAKIPAVCENCNILFPSPIELINVSHFRFQSMGVRCPLCGEWGYIPDGDYSVVDDVIEFFSHGTLTLDNLRSLHTVITEVINERTEPQRAVKKIKAKAPELGSILDRFSNVPVLWQWGISMVFTLLSLILSVDAYVNRPPSKTEIQEMFEKAIERLYEPRPDVREQPPRQLQPSPRRSDPYRAPLPDLRQPQPKILEPYRAPQKPGPNDPCTCGSGKKYKKCCWI